MAQMAPPEPPRRIALDDGDDVRRLRVRLWRISLALATIFIMAWFFTLGWVPGIVAAMIGKHVLVAILVMDLGVDERRGADFS